MAASRCGWLRKQGRLVSRPCDCLQSACWIRLTFDDVNDLVCVRAKNDVLAPHEDELVSTPFRIDFHDTRRQRMIADAGRDSRTDRETEVHVCNFLDLLLLDRRG